ncbi:MAG: biotin carboxylase N-terminal domain-containing protein, partial [Candidatus Palauibacterales bacterium]|nr:biotin carboxylase N-terminal domain-containing protein [Candidatus Palauibacterales bacterium]
MSGLRRVLIANRGEIAVRVIRACRELGIETVAVYSDPDRLAPHVRLADRAVLVGPAPASESYLDVGRLLEAARRTGADSVHPGYGFLAENPDFADACAAARLTFIGPPPEVMRRFGNKVAARHLAEAAGAPVMPASAPLPDDAAETARIAAGIGYPLMLKASWGGGGRGMRVIEGEGESVEAARREAKAAFGNDEVYLEKLVRRARHVEVQIIADGHGAVSHLFERDCTVQRRHQKVVERAPAPYIDAGQRAALTDSAVRIAREAGYVNAGTVEFLQDADDG